MPAAGLSALYEALAHTAARLGVDGFALAVDDPDLGRQVFAVGPAARAVLADAVADPARRWWAHPSTAEPPAELDALGALAATALQLARVDPGSDPASALEVLVRSLAPVRGVVRVGSVVEASLTPGHRDDVVGRLAASDLPAGGALVLHEAVPHAAAASRPRARAELLAVRTMPETGELEVHLRAGDRRTVGRGPLGRAGHAAAAATLAALAGLAPEPALPGRWHVGWVRTLDTTPDREFLVAVMIRRGTDPTLYGIATGASPVEAAARATLHASNRVVGRPPPD